MQINIFEGARRITKLIALIWVIGWGYYLIDYEPHYQPYFQIDFPTSVPKIIDGACERDSASGGSNIITSKGKHVFAIICFNSYYSIDEKKLVPYKKVIPTASLENTITKLENIKSTLRKAHEAGNLDDARHLSNAYLELRNSEIIEKESLIYIASNKLFFVGNIEASPEVTKYKEELSSNFKISLVDDVFIDEKLSNLYLKELKQTIVTVLMGLATIFILTWCIGWIVRGFAGIPSGHDKKPDDI